MRLRVKSILSRLIKKIIGNSIAGKPYNGIYYLYYEKPQHLIFAFKRKINYEPIIQNKCKSYIKTGDLVFDVGANIGQYALLFSSLAGKDGKVISIEPDFRNYSFLQFNCNINKCDNVICLNIGLGADESELAFFRDTVTGGRKGSFIQEFSGEKHRGAELIVKVNPLQNLFKDYGIPQFIKIDVEGFEEKVLKGLLNIPETCTFLIEVRKETKKQVFSIFDQKKFKCLYIDKPQDIEIKSEDQIPDFANLVFVPLN
jgi:FkbM family methyltransferase